MGQRQLVVAVETTAALGASWPVLFTEYVEKIIRFYKKSRLNFLINSVADHVLGLLT